MSDTRYKAQRQGSGDLWWVLKLWGKRSAVVAQNLSEADARAKEAELNK